MNTLGAISVVIITKNEADNITDCISNVRLVSDDIIVVDSGSTDTTVKLAEQAGARVIPIKWNGFGDARNIGAANARYDWILSVDADERVASDLALSIKNSDKDDCHVVYGFKRRSFFLGKKIRFGEWGKDSVYRLYNRNHVSWDRSAVHEELTGENITKKMLNGIVEHYTVTSEAENKEKTARYAILSAEKYFAQGKRATIPKRYVSPAFNFFKSYFLLLGFLDGKPGFIIAQSAYRYALLKYDLLHKLNKAKK